MRINIPQYATTSQDIIPPNREMLLAALNRLNERTADQYFQANSFTHFVLLITRPKTEMFEPVDKSSKNTIYFS